MKRHGLLIVAGGAAIAALSLMAGMQVRPETPMPTARYDYRVEAVRVPTADAYRDLVQETARGGWRLVTVDNGVLFFERPAS